MALQAAGADLCRHHANPSPLLVPLRYLLRKAPGPQQESRQLCFILCSTGNLGCPKALGFWGFWLLIDLPSKLYSGYKPGWVVAFVALLFFLYLPVGFFPALSDSPVPSLGSPHSPAAHVLPTTGTSTRCCLGQMSPTNPMLLWHLPHSRAEIIPHTLSGFCTSGPLQFN